MIDTQPIPMPSMEIVPTLAAGTQLIDGEAVMNALHVCEQALATANLAHLTIRNLLGLTDDAPVLPAPRQQVV